MPPEHAEGVEQVIAAVVATCDPCCSAADAYVEFYQEFKRRTSIIDVVEVSVGAVGTRPTPLSPSCTATSLTAFPLSAGHADSVLDKSLQKLRQKVSLNKRRLHRATCPRGYAPRVHAAYAVQLGLPTAISTSTCRTTAPHSSSLRCSKHHSVCRYVLPQVIAMGFPSEGKEALFVSLARCYCSFSRLSPPCHRYRNPLPEVRRFLSLRHGLQNCRSPC